MIVPPLDAAQQRPRNLRGGGGARGSRREVGSCGSGVAPSAAQSRRPCSGAIPQRLPRAAGSGASPSRPALPLPCLPLPLPARALSALNSLLARAAFTALHSGGLLSISMA